MGVHASPVVRLTKVLLYGLIVPALLRSGFVVDQLVFYLKITVSVALEESSDNRDSNL